MDIDTATRWDWPSVCDRFQTLADFLLDCPPDNHSELANELRDIADWIEDQGN